MKKILSILSVVTFMNAKVIILSILLVCITVYGSTYVTSSMDRNTQLIDSITQNEREMVEISNINYNIVELNNKILSKCLDKRNKYRTLSQDVDSIAILKAKLDIDSLRSAKIDSLLGRKIIVFTKIANFNGALMNLDGVMYNKTIQVVGKTVKKGIFKTKIEYDTITKKYDDISIKLFNNEYNRVILKNSSSLNSLIKENNELNLEINAILNIYSVEKFEANFIEYQKISKTIQENLINYIMGTIIIMVVFSVVVLLLISDIAKKHKSERRDRDMIDMLIEQLRK